MSLILLFCIANEAIPFARSVLNGKYTVVGDDIPESQYYHVESKNFPDTPEGFKTTLAENEPYVSDWINATVPECKSWALKEENQRNFVDQHLIAIADERSARDGTLLFSSYWEGRSHIHVGFGPLPKVINTWYDYRVHPKDPPQIHVDLCFGAIEIGREIYYGLKEDLTNENGTFNMEQARRYKRGLDEIPEPDPDPKWQKLQDLEMEELDAERDRERKREHERQNMEKLTLQD